MDSTTSGELLSRFHRGDDGAAAEIFDRYVSRLLQLTRQRLSAKLARRVDPEDIVQSAYRSFFVHARDGDYVLQRAGDLWRLLVAITLHKLHGQVELHTAQKRDVDREQDCARDESASVAASLAAGAEPSPLEASEVTEQLSLFMDELSAVERRVLQFRLAGQTIQEIAGQIGRSERTVRRLLQVLREALQQRLAGPS